MRHGRRTAPCFIVGEVIAGFRQRLDGVDDRQAELDGEIVIALVAARHCHDRAGAVVHEHVVGGEQRQLSAGDRVDGVQAGEQAGLLARLVHAVLGGLGFGGQTGLLGDLASVASLLAFGLDLAVLGLEPLVEAGLGLGLGECAFCYAAQQVLLVHYAFVGEDRPTGVGGLCAFE